MTGRAAALRRPGSARDGAASVLAELAGRLLGTSLPVRLRAWDGSEAGPASGPVVIIRSRTALRQMLWRPGELGLARAYVTGGLDVDGDLTEGLRALWRAVGPLRGQRARLGPAGWLAAGRAAVALRIAGPPPPAPAAEVRISGRVHSRRRDQQVISAHYDLPPAFYQLILDPAMAYSCAWWTSDEASYTLADAQRDKLDMICRKMRLRPGSRLLDIGCGWGSLAIHAARDYGARVTAVTLAGEQAAFVRDRARAVGLADLVAVEMRDYRDIGSREYDAVASIEMGEHVGQRAYPAFCAQLRDLLRPGGRLLIQQMSRGARAPGGGAFISAYVATDMHMRPVGETVALLEQAGLRVEDVQAMPAHYARTIRAWLGRLEEAHGEVTALIGEEQARVWRLYLAGGALAFEDGRMGVHQIAATRPQ